MEEQFFYENTIDLEVDNSNNLECIDYKYIPIKSLDISARLKHILICNNITTFEEFLRCSNENIRKFRNAGVKTVDEALELKNNPNKVFSLILAGEKVGPDNLERVKILESSINQDFVQSIYSDISFKDLEMSIRLINCLYQNKILTVPDFLMTPIDNIKLYRNLGRKSFDEAVEIKIRLLDFSKPGDTSKVLYFFIKKITKDEPKSVVFIKNYLIKNTNYDIDSFVNDLNKLKNENVIETSMNGIIIKKKTVIEYINSMEDEKKKKIIMLRLNGHSLEDIAKKEGVTRERIRQISSKVISNMPEVKETKYKYVYEKYSFTKNDFCKIFNESQETYYFLKLLYESGEKDIVEGLESNDFNEYQKNIIRRISNKITLFGKTIDCTKLEIIKVLSEEYASEEMTFDEFTDIYNNFVKTNNNYNLEFTDDRSIEGILSRQDNIIFDLGRKFRYLNFSFLDRSIIEKIHRILDLEEGYYSTLVLFNDNLDLMKELDIRNEYELHNFLKKKATCFTEIKLDRMPNFSRGNINKHDFTINKINELAPISISDFLDFLEKNYGHKTSSFSSYLLAEFSEFIKGSFIDSDVIEINDTLIKELQKIFNEPVYSIDTVKVILRNNGYDNVDEIITKNNMYKIGYKIRSSYILRKDYDSVEDYYLELSRTVDFIPNEYSLARSTYNASIKNLQKNFDIILISNKEFITIKKLNQLNINKEMMSKFCTDVISCFENINYFTIYNIKNSIDTSWIEEHGFDDRFYECLVETIEEIRLLRINNQKIYSFVDDNVEVDDIIDEFMIEDSISVDELIDSIKEKYGIEVSPEKLIYSNKYYSKELNKLYLDKECYYKEVYNYE